MARINSRRIKIGGMNQLMIDLKPRRCDADVFINTPIDVTNLVNYIDKRKKDGCISVEMECSTLEALCDFRNLNLYIFFTSGDLLDAPKWDRRHKDNDLFGTQHDINHFDIAIELANYVIERGKI